MDEVVEKVPVVGARRKESEDLLVLANLLQQHQLGRHLRLRPLAPR